MYRVRVWGLFSVRSSPHFWNFHQITPRSLPFCFRVLFEIWLAHCAPQKKKKTARMSKHLLRSKRLLTSTYTYLLVHGSSLICGVCVSDGVRMLLICVGYVWGGAYFHLSRIAGPFQSKSWHVAQSSSALNASKSSSSTQSKRLNKRCWRCKTKYKAFLNRETPLLISVVIHASTYSSKENRACHAPALKTKTSWLDMAQTSFLFALEHTAACMMICSFVSSFACLPIRTPFGYQRTTEKIPPA